MSGIARGWRMLSRIVALGCVLALPAVAADAVREVHGSSDAYAEAGIALAWGVRRGADEATTKVTLRIVADPARYPRVGAARPDPSHPAQAGAPPAQGAPGPARPRVPGPPFPRRPPPRPPRRNARRHLPTPDAWPQTAGAGQRPPRGIHLQQRGGRRDVWVRLQRRGVERLPQPEVIPEPG